ncbi:MAG: 50S ribosomal protein L22 [Sulfolobales archaeon]
MPSKWIYPEIADEEKTAKALGRELPISFKESEEIAKVIKGMRLDEAIKYLENVVQLREPVPMTRHNKQLSHHSGVAEKFPKWRVPVGRYPVKAARYILRVLRNARNNAENKGLDPEKLVIVHAAAHRGRYLKRYMPRAFARATPKFRSYTNFEIVVREVA